MLVDDQRTDQRGQGRGDDHSDTESGELVPSNMTWVDVRDGTAKMSRLHEVSSESDHIRKGTITVASIRLEWTHAGGTV
jgi:hypothetical protein